MSTPGPFQDKPARDDLAPNQRVQGERAGPTSVQDAPALRVEALSLARGGRVLFEYLSFTAEAGAYVEIRGANGAGKTSLLRAIAGFLRPRAGRIAFDRIEEPALALHYVAHLNALKPTASVAAHVRYWASLFGGAGGADALERVGLAGLEDRQARTLSQGQARRLSLARLIAAPRPIWLLDEPAAALDAQGHDIVARLIEAHRQDGGLVLAAVHEALGPAPSQTLAIGAA
jgi:heme exporter protein A